MEQSNRTGTFVAMMDDEVFKSLSPEQLNAIADRAWRRRKKLTAEQEGATDTAPHEHEHLLCLKTAEADKLRQTIEPQFAELFARWRFGDIVHEEDGLDVVEYWVDFADTVTPGVVSDTLRSSAGPLLVRLELK